MKYGKLDEEGKVLLARAQKGDKMAENDLLAMVMMYAMPKRIGRYISRNRQVDNDDLRQEFMIGVALSIKNAKMDVGDPIEYMITSGLYKVKSYMRKHILQGTMQVCSDCGTKSRLNRVGNNMYQCRKCGSLHVTTVETDDHNEFTLESIPDNRFEDDVISQIMVEDFAKTLTPGTNVERLYRLLLDGVDRDNPLVRNYLGEIAKEWGGCSTENVMQNLKKLRNRLDRWMSDNNEQHMDQVAISVI